MADDSDSSSSHGLSIEGTSEGTASSMPSLLDPLEQQTTIDSNPTSHTISTSESSIEIDQVSQWLVEHDVDSVSEISSEELALWIEALEPCECCGLRTPFRCRNCGRVVCLDPTCRNRHSTVCDMSWKQWFWSLFGCFHFWRRG